MGGLLSRGIRLYAYCVDLYVPFASLRRSKVDLKVFVRWQDLCLQKSQQAKQAKSLAELIDGSDEIAEARHSCFEELRAWRFYEKMDASIVGVEFSPLCNRVGDDVIITLWLLGSEDVVDSRHMAKMVYDSSVKGGLHPRVREALMPRAWIRPDTLWEEAPMTGYMIGEDGEWTLDSESSALDGGT